MRQPLDTCIGWLLWFLWGSCFSRCLLCGWKCLFNPRLVPLFVLRWFGPARVGNRTWLIQSLISALDCLFDASRALWVHRSTKCSSDWWLASSRRCSMSRFGCWCELSALYAWQILIFVIWSSSGIRRRPLIIDERSAFTAAIFRVIIFLLINLQCWRWLEATLFHLFSLSTQVFWLNNWLQSVATELFCWWRLEQSTTPGIAIVLGGNSASLLCCTSPSLHLLTLNSPVLLEGAHHTAALFLDTASRLKLQTRLKIERFFNIRCSLGSLNLVTPTVHGAPPGERRCNDRASALRFLETWFTSKRLIILSGISCTLLGDVGGSSIFSSCVIGIIFVWYLCSILLNLFSSIVEEAETFALFPLMTWVAWRQVHGEKLFVIICVRQFKFTNVVFGRLCGKHNVLLYGIATLEVVIDQWIQVWLYSIVMIVAAFSIWLLDGFASFHLLFFQLFCPQSASFGLLWHVKLL